MKEYINFRNILVLLLIIVVIAGSVYFGGKYFLKDRTASGDTNITIEQIEKKVNKESKNRYNEIINSYGGKDKAEAFFQANGTSSEEVLANLKDEILRRELMEKYRNEVEVSEEEIDLYVMKNDHLLPQQNVRIYQSYSKEALEPILEKLKAGEEVSTNEDIEVYELDLGMNWDLIWNETKYLQAGQWTDIFVDREVHTYEISLEDEIEEYVPEVVEPTQIQEELIDEVAEVELPEGITEFFGDVPLTMEVTDEFETWYIVQVLHLYSLDEKKELVVDRFVNEQAYNKLHETLIELENKDKE